MLRRKVDNVVKCIYKHDKVQMIMTKLSYQVIIYISKHQMFIQRRVNTSSMTLVR